MNFMHRTLFIVSGACTFLFALPGPVLAQADPPATIVWTGANNNSWDVPANWNPARVPNASDHVEIATGTNVQFNVPASISSLRLGQSSGSSTQTLVMNAGQTLTLATNSTVNSNGVISISSGAIAGSGWLSVQGRMDWGGGVLAGTLEIAPGATLNLIGPANKFIGGNSTLRNQGTITWEGSGDFGGPIGARVENFGLFEVRNDQAFFDSEYYDYGRPVFVNAGRFRKSGGTGATRFEGGNQGTLFTNVGIVEIQSGTLSLRSATALGHGGTFAGAGFTSQDAGAVTIFGTNTLAADATVQLSTATMNGTGAFAGPGSLQWTNGASLNATLTILPESTLRLAASTYSEINAGTLLNLGLVLQQGAGSFHGRNGCAIRNLGTWALGDNTAFLDSEYYDYVSPVFENLGTLRKSGGAGAVTFDGGNQGFVLTNASLVQIDSGSLRLRSSTKLGPGGTFAGAGFTSQDIGEITFFGTNTLSASTLFQIGPAVIHGNNGAVGGSGMLQWTNGSSLSGTLTILPSAVLRLASSSSSEINGGTLVNFGTVEHSGGGSFNGRNGCLIRNLGTWALRSDAPFVDVEYYDYISPQFENRGTLFKDVAGTNIFRLDNQGFQFHNAGLAYVQAGTVAFNGGGAHTNGEFRVNADATLEMASGQHTLRDGARFRVSGLARVAGAGLTQVDTTNTILVGGHFVFSSGTLGGRSAIGGPGTVTWSGGTLAGTNMLLAGGTMNISGAATKQIAPNSGLVNAGTMRWTDNGDIAGQIASVLRNEGVFEARNDRSFVDNEYYDYGNPRFQNTGTFRKVASTGTTRFGGENQGFAFVNDGVLEVTTGTVRFESTFTPGGSSTTRLTVGGATPGTEFGRLVHSGAMNLAGQLQVVLTNGFAPTNGQTFTVVTSGSLGGDFATTTLPALAAGLTWSIDQNPTSVVLGIENLPPCAAPPGDLVWWAPGEGNANDVIGGSLGVRHDGAGFSAGRVGRGFRLDGAGDFVSFPDSPSLRVTNLTIEGWFKFFSLGGPRILVSKTVGSGILDSYALWIQDGNLHFAVADQAGYGVITTPMNPAVYTWYHLAATFDDEANVMRLFTNGVLAVSQTENRSIAYDSHPLLIGAAYENESLAFFAHGLFDEVAIYKRALASNEVASLFAAGLSGKCTNGLPAAPACLLPPANLVGWWPGDGHTNNLVAGGDPVILLNGAAIGSGLVKEGFSFDGIDDLIAIGDLPALQDATELTLMAWVAKPYRPLGNRPDNLGAIIGKWDSFANPAANSFLLFNGEDVLVDRGEFALQFTDDSQGRVQGTTIIPESEWTHLAATWSSSNGLMKLYKNGVLDGVSTNGPGKTLRHHTQFTAKIGEWGPNTRPNSRWKGFVDEPMIFNRALSSNEIGAIGAAGTAGVCRPSGSTSNATTTVTLVTSTADWRESTTNDTSNADSTPWPGAAFFPDASTYTITPTAGAAHVAVVPDATTLVGLSSVRFFRASFNLPNFDSLTADIRASFDNDLQIFINGHELALEGDLSGASFSLPNHRLFVQTDGSVINGYEGGAGFSGGVAANFPASYFQAGANEVLLALRNLNGGDGGGVAFRAEFTMTGAGTNALPDLMVTGVNGPGAAIMGQAVPLVYTLSNPGAATAFGPWLNEVRIATNASGGGAQTIGTVLFTGELAPGSSLSVTQSVILPAGVSGARFLGVTADALGAITESNETNNSAFASVAISINAADLVSGDLNAPAGAQFGQDVTVTYSVTNFGTATASAAGIDQIFLSATSNSIAGATFLKTVSAAPLNVGASYSRTQAVTLPLATDLSAGTYFFVIAADAGDAQSESREDNNLVSRAITLSYPPLPDLAVTRVLAPIFISGGNTARIVWTTTNQGPLTVTAPWSDVVAISNSVSGVQALQEFLFTNALPAGASITSTQDVAIPLNLPAGDWRFLVTTDDRRDIFEQNESNNTGYATNTSEVPAELALTFPVEELTEGAPAVLATVTRNGDRSAPLTITITNGDPSELRLTNSVIIPAGQDSTTFAVTPLPDGIVDGSPFVLFSVNAPDYRSASIGVTVRDIDVPRLFLSVGATSVVEGLTFPVTVRRDYATNLDVTVVLSAADPRELSVPASVIIRSNQLSASFTILAEDDNVVEALQTQTFLAMAAGFESATASIMIVDNDTPLLSLRIAAESVSEGDGPQATTVTITRTPASARGLTLQLESSNPALAQVPATVVIPGNETAVSFPIAVTDNGTVDGTRTVTIRAFLRDSAGNLLAELSPATLQVLDDDGPTLKVALARHLTAEGLNPASSATVTRNTATNASLTVTLSSSDTTELTVPAGLTIPAGESSASFDVATPLDSITDGSQTAIVTASAPGFTSGSALIVVTDIDLPDLTVVSLTTPTNGLTDGNFTITYRVENRGIAPSTSPFRTRVLLSTDTFASNDDSVLSESLFEGSLPVGLFIERTEQFRLPNAPGRYWIIVVADTGNAVAEVLENNNEFISALPIDVVAAYVATVETPVTTALTGSAVPMSGSAWRAGTGLPAVNVSVNVHLLLRGTRRLLSAVTDVNGNFTATFTPLPGEAGVYEIGAAHPGAAVAPVQDTFTLFGLKVVPPANVITVTEGGSSTGALAVVNLGETPLTGLSASVVSSPANLDVSLTLSSPSLSALGSNQLGFVITASDATTPFGEVRVRVTSSSGASSDAVLPIAVESLQPRLVASPENLYTAMVRGGQASVDFTVANLGGVASEPILISLPNVPWLRVGSANPLPALAPGQSNQVTLLLTPEPDLPLGPYTGSISLDAGAVGLDLPFTFRAMADLKGDLLVEAVDEFTYYAAGAPKVTNAPVIVRDAFTRQTITNGVTDAQGQVLFPQLTEGHYEVEVTAADHSPFVGTLFLSGGRTNLFETFLSRQMVEYRWTVVPTEIADRTRIVIETLFETFVPAPVITIEPALIDLAGFTGTRTQINLTIKNHGLVAAQDFMVNFPDHPDFSFMPLVTDIGTLRAQATLVVPLLIERKSGAGLRVQAASGGPCSIAGGACWQLPCGPRRNQYCASVAVMNINCPPPANIPGAPGGHSGYALPPVPNGLGGGIATGGGRGGGGTPFVPPRRFEPPQVCDCDAASFDPTCIQAKLESTPIGGPIAALKSALQGKIPYLEEFDVSVSGNAQLCTCCEEGSVGFKASGSGSIDFKGKINVPLGPAFPPLSLPSFSIAGYEVHVEAKVGCFFTPSFTAKATVSGKTDCFFENIEACGEMNVEFSAVANCGISGEVLLVKDGVTNKTALEADAGSISTGLKGSVKYCYNGESENTLCSEGVKIKLGSIKITLPDGTEHSHQLAEIVLIEGTYPEAGEGGRPGPFLAKADWVLAGDAAVQRGKDAAQALAQSILNAKAVAKGQTPEPDVSAAGGEEGVCARVRLQIDQEVVMARNAFNATLELINNSPTPIENVSITLVVVDEFGNGVDERFGVRPPTLAGLTGVDGSGIIVASGSGSASWILVPTSEAAPLGPTRYGVGGVLSYRQDGRQISIPLFPAPITVHPDPRLTIKYFHQRDVFADDPFTRDVIEPSIPFNLAVLVQNKGRGTARNVRIVSGQPQIIENEKGLLIDFKIIGTEVSGQAQSPSLTATFGEIGPDSNAYGRWLLTSTLQGLFLDYKATFEHLDSLGKTNLSLIEVVTIHEMTHLVQAPGALEDGRPDFLVNDVQDPDALPDTLYLSTGATNPVAVVQQANAAAPNAGDLDVQLTAAMPQGWGYLRVPDPADGQFQLQRVVRSDGVEIYFGTNVWTTDRTFLGQGRRPVRENILHLLDYNSTGSYTLYYTLPPPVDTNAPSSAVQMLALDSYAQFTVIWSGTDEVNGSGLSMFDVYVSVDGGPFAPWLQGTSLNSSVYQGQAGHTYAFYSVGVDVKGNRETAPVAPDATTTISLVNTAPLLAYPASVTVDEGQTLSLTPTASDADPGQTLTFTLGSGAPAGIVLNSANGRLLWPTGEGNGPGTNQIRVILSDNGQPSLSATSTVTVVVNEVNSAPSLMVITNRAINELQTLTLPLLATDSDLPAQTLTFSLGAGAPLGATLNSSNGVFTWTPTTTQGPTTNGLTVIVRDNGTPPLSATQSFTVIVRDTGADFTVSLGNMNLYAGQSGHVPVNFQSGFDLTNISFVLNLSTGGLTNLTLAPTAATVGSVTLSPAGLNRYEVRLAAGLGEVFEGVGEFARLAFDTSTNFPSALVYLKPISVTGVRSTGELLPKGGGGQGRVIVVNREPILVASAPPRRLEVFGRPGVTYDLLSSTNVLGPWLPAGNVTLAEAISSILTLPVSTQNTFYRAMENPGAEALLLEYVPVGNQINFTIRGETGRTYTFQSAPAMTGPWGNDFSQTLTNGFHSFSRTNGGEPAKFFRVRRDN